MSDFTPAGEEAHAERGRENRILVLAVGNPLFGDDGLGAAALALLQKEDEEESGEVDFVDGGIMGLYLIDRICGYNQVLVLDSVNVDEPSGTVVTIEGEDVATTFKTRISAHQQGVNDLLAALTLMDRRPREISIVGMVPESLSMDIGLSDTVEKALPKMVKTARKCLMIFKRNRPKAKPEKLSRLFNYLEKHLCF